MKFFLAFTKKELLAQLRTGKTITLTILFVLFGIMNPAVAKLTPWLMEMMADSLAESGMILTDITVTAMDSWVQFFKNIPMALIVFVLMQSSIFTKEYQTGTLILSLTKGLPRHTVLLAKTVILTLFWTVGYWLCFGITYGYNAYFWDNAVAHNLLFSALCWWMFSLWILSLMIFFSTLSASTTGVLIGTGGVVFASTLLSIIPKLQKYLPTLLSDGNALIYGTADAKSYTAALVITASLLLLCLTFSIPLFHKKQL